MVQFVQEKLIGQDLHFRQINENTIKYNDNNLDFTVENGVLTYLNYYNDENITANFMTRNLTDVIIINDEIYTPSLYTDAFYSPSYLDEFYAIAILRNHNDSYSVWTGSEIESHYVLKINRNIIEVYNHLNNTTASVFKYQNKYKFTNNQGVRCLAVNRITDEFAKDFITPLYRKHYYYFSFDKLFDLVNDNYDNINYLKLKKDYINIERTYKMVKSARSAITH